jgi:hypothetical protein
MLGSRWALGRSGHDRPRTQKPSAPGRIRTRDPLLRRHRRGIAVCRLVSLNMPSNCTDASRLWPGIAWRLRPMAPSLAPRSSRHRSGSNERKCIGCAARLRGTGRGRAGSSLPGGEGQQSLAPGHGDIRDCKRQADVEQRHAFAVPVAGFPVDRRRLAVGTDSLLKPLQVLQCDAETINRRALAEPAAGFLCRQCAGRMLAGGASAGSATSHVQADAAGSRSDSRSLRCAAIRTGVLIAP